MLSFGMPPLIELPNAERCAALCRRLGLDFVELNMNLPQYQTPCMDRSLLPAVMREYGIYFTIHLDENLNIADFNPYVASAYRRTVLETIDLARHIGAPILNMHLPRGVYFTLPDRRVHLFGEYREQYLSAVRSFRDECTACIGESGVRILVENTNGFLPFQVEALDALLESPAFGLTLDVGHYHAAGCADEAFLNRCLAALHHVHLHDALPGSDHLALGTGSVDLTRYLSLAEQHSSRVVVETKTVSSLERSVDWLRANRFIQ